MRALAPPPRGGFEWWSWFVFDIYLYQGCKLLTDGWPEASELVLIGVQTQLRTTKKSEETNYKDPKKVNGDFMLTLCWSFHCLKFWLLLLIAQVNNILEWCKSLFYISTWKFSIMLSTSYHRHFVYRRLLFMIWSSFIKKQLGTDHLAVDIVELLFFELSLRFIIYQLAPLWGLQTCAFISIKL